MKNVPDILRDRKGLSRSGSLTPELLRTFEGCEHYSDEQAQEIVFGLQSLAGILFELYSEQNNNSKTDMNI